MPNAPDPLLRSAEVAERLNISVARLRDWRYRGVGPRFIRLSPKAVRYRSSEVERFIDDREQGGARDARRAVEHMRTEDQRLLTGQGRYVDDLPLPGALHGAVLRSPLAHARITHLDVMNSIVLSADVSNGFSSLNGAANHSEPLERVDLKPISVVAPTHYCQLSHRRSRLQ